MALAGFQVEEAENITGVEAETGVADLGVAKNALKQFSFLLQNAVDSFFDRVVADELCDQDRTF